MYGLDPFSTGKNGAGLYFWGSIDLSFQAESIDTHNDHDFEIFGSLLAPFPPRASICAKIDKNATFLPIIIAVKVCFG